MEGRIAEQSIPPAVQALQQRAQESGAGYVSEGANRQEGRAGGCRRAELAQAGSTAQACGWKRLA